MANKQIIILPRVNELAAIKGHERGKRLTYREIAEGIGYDKMVVSRYMRGDVTRFDKDVLEAFCVYFDCEVGDLFKTVEIPDTEEGEDTVTPQVA